jgi:hypothetical protein
MNVMRLLGIVLLSIASLAVLVGMVLPVAGLILGLGIDVPNFLARSGKVYLILSYPWVSFLAGLLLLLLFGRSIWKLTH